MAAQFDQNLYQVGQKIREVRLQKGISQTELALTMGTTKTAISYWENGERALRLDSYFKLAQALEVPPSLFLMESKEEYSEESILLESISRLPKEKKQLILQAARMMVMGAQAEKAV